MKDQWYADNRDLVKWSVLLHLAAQKEATAILQVAYYRPTSWDKTVEIDGESYPLQPAVLKHFRNIREITRLDATIPVLLLDNCCEDRIQYIACILERILTLPERSIVFLDPDTGLEPRKAGLEHVRGEELNRIWNALRPGDILVLYQHQTNRNGQPWISERKGQFEQALGLPLGVSKLAQGTRIARDVAFFFASR